MSPILNPVQLTGAQRRALRGKGHHLKAVVQVGQHGITEAVVHAVRTALEQHELIKVSIAREAPIDRKTGGAELATLTGSHLVQVIGRIALLYRRRWDNPVIALPGAIEEAPRPTGGVEPAKKG